MKKTSRKIAVHATHGNISDIWEWKHDSLRVVINHSTWLDFWNQVKTFLLRRKDDVFTSPTKKMSGILSDLSSVVASTLMLCELRCQQLRGRPKISLRQYKLNFRWLSTLPLWLRRVSARTGASLSCSYDPSSDTSSRKLLLSALISLVLCT